LDKEVERREQTLRRYVSDDLDGGLSNAGDHFVEIARYSGEMRVNHQKLCENGKERTHLDLISFCNQSETRIIENHE